MKRVISFLLITIMAVSLFAGCGAAGNTETTGDANAEATFPTLAEPVFSKEALQGKKVIFFGNSFTYYGNCVQTKGQSVWWQSERVDDNGYFYQICRANGVDVSVTNFTFGGHTLKDIYSGDCQADRGHNGLNHLDHLTDRNYDYVVMQNGSKSADAGEILNECKPIMELFLKENPNTRFVFLVHHAVHSSNYAWRSTIKQLDEAGITVVDWGALVNDVLSGTTAVPGAVETYNKNSFIVNQSESDGFHPNLLTGYITAQMLYCALTGEKAVGQDYTCCMDQGVFTLFRAKYYTYDRNTNFENIFASAADMNGLQQLMDQYLEEKGYRNY